jgi:hypothetical protein
MTSRRRTRAPSGAKPARPRAVCGQRRAARFERELRLVLGSAARRAREEGAPGVQAGIVRVAGGWVDQYKSTDGCQGEHYFHITDPDGNELSFAKPLVR